MRKSLIFIFFVLALISGKSNAEDADFLPVDYLYSAIENDLITLASPTFDSSDVLYLTFLLFTFTTEVGDTEIRPYLIFLERLFLEG